MPMPFMFEFLQIAEESIGASLKLMLLLRYEREIVKFKNRQDLFIYWLYQYYRFLKLNVFLMG